MNPIAPTFTPKSRPFATLPPKTRDPSSEDSGTLSKPDSSQTSGQWSDEVAAAEEEKAIEAAEAAKAQEIDSKTLKTDDVVTSSKSEQKRQAFQQAVDRALKRDGHSKDAATRNGKLCSQPVSSCADYGADLKPET